MTAFLSAGPETAPTTLMLAPGAGASMTSAWMDRMSDLLAEQGVRVVRFDFAYMAARQETGSRRPPPKAEKLVAEVPNVRSVTNEIRVAGIASATSRANDATITARVKGGFVNVKELNPLHVKVVTEAGVVYLLGLVTEAEADKATEVARTTGGVRKVVKVFEYCDTGDERCRPAPPPAEKPKPPRT